MNARSLIIAAVLLLATAGGAFWFHHTFVWSEEPLDLGYDLEARRNPYLAAQQFLERAGGAVVRERSLARLDALPPPDDALLVPKLPAYLSPARAAALEAWVRAGGLLIAVAHPGRASPGGAGDEPFLARFGVKTETDTGTTSGKIGAPEGEEDRGEVDEDDTAATPPTEAGDDDDWLDYLTAIRFEGDDAELHLNLGLYAWRETLTDTSGTLVASGSSVTGAQILYYEPGAGQLVALTSASFLRNQEIGHFDHALFLQNLIDGRKLWILDSGDYPGLAELLWQQQRPAVIAGGVFIALLLWGLGGRFGPRFTEIPLPRRSLREHLRAAGGFHWHADRGASLLSRMRTDIEVRATLHHSAWPRLTEAHRLAWLAPLAGLPEAQLRTALFEPPPRDELGFAECVRTLQSIRKCL